MSSFTAIDLSRLPAPSVVETLDYEALLAQYLAKLQALDPAFTALVESDPAYKLIEAVAYQAMLLRQRVNDAARAVMLAFATGADLDQLGALVGVARLTVDPGDPGNGVAATMETDTDFRRRIQLAPEGFSTAGPVGAYVFHALGADAAVSDASASSPTPDDIRALVLGVLADHGAAASLVTAMETALDDAAWPGDVEVVILARTGSGLPSADTLSAVTAALSAEDVRPLTDSVTVKAADIIHYTVEARLDVFNGPDPTVVRQASQDAVETYVTAQRKIGLPVTRSGLFAALHTAGVVNVHLVQPAADILVSDSGAAVCTGVSVEIQ